VCRAEKAAERAREAAEEKARKEKEERDELIKSNPMLRQELGLEEESSFQVLPALIYQPFPLACLVLQLCATVWSVLMFNTWLCVWHLSPGGNAA
jgi:hypothetical protein